MATRKERRITIEQKQSSERKLFDFWKWLDENHITHRVMLYFTLWFTFDCAVWARHFAENTKLDGVGTATVIAAATAPATALMGYVFKIYSDRKNFITESNNESNAA